MYQPQIRPEPTKPTTFPFKTGSFLSKAEISWLPAKDPPLDKEQLYLISSFDPLFLYNSNNNKEKQ